jgi:hypothetical protein
VSYLEEPALHVALGVSFDNTQKWKGLREKVQKLMLPVEFSTDVTIINT